VSPGVGIVECLRVEVARGEALRFLGYPPGHARAAAALTRLDAVWDAALTLLAPRGAWAVVDGAAAAAAGVPAAAERAAVAVCTIGPALEGESARRAAAGDPLAALLLDAIGSAAAEAAADALNLVVCHAALARGLRAAARVSPGYGGWDTACQRELLALLPAAALGIVLTDGGMMVPRKSVSFAASLREPGAEDDADGSPCRHCGLERCRHRMAGYAGAIPECV
jgi:hypothetical protein